LKACLQPGSCSDLFPILHAPELLQQVAQPLVPLSHNRDKERAQRRRVVGEARQVDVGRAHRCRVWAAAVGLGIRFGAPTRDQSKPSNSATSSTSVIGGVIVSGVNTSALGPTISGTSPGGRRDVLCFTGRPSASRRQRWIRLGEGQFGDKAVSLFSSMPASSIARRIAS
jgi:hypothetical protein